MDDRLIKIYACLKVWDLKSDFLGLISGCIANQLCDLEKVFNHTKSQLTNFQNWDNKSTYLFRWVGILSTI